jgi:hypothetical protein
MTAAATRAAFAVGAELAVLSPGDEGAMRLYEHIGYAPVEAMLHYVDRSEQSISSAAFVFMA